MSEARKGARRLVMVESQDLKQLALVVDPSAPERMQVAKLCERFQLSVSEAHDLPSALQAIVARRPTIIITAWELGPMTAYTLTQALSTVPEFAAIPVAVLTPHTDRARRSIRSRNHWVVPKQGQNMASLENALRSIGFVNPDSKEPRQPPLFGLILVADDSVVNQRVLARTLLVAGAEVVTADDGLEALELLPKRPYDLLLMDIEMPGLSGLETIQRVRELGYTLPALAITGRDADQIREEAIHAGFDNVMTKPVDRHRLVLRCARYLKDARQREIQGQGEPQPS